MGEPKVKSNQLKLPQDIEDMRLSKSKKPYSNPNQLQLFSIVESQPVLSETIALDRLISSLNNTPMQKLDQKLEADSISGEKDLSPFWNEYCFSARLYGLRKYKKQISQELQEDNPSSSRRDKEASQQCLENQGIPVKRTP